MRIVVAGVVVLALVDVDEARSRVEDGDGPVGDDGRRVERVDEKVRERLDVLAALALPRPLGMRRENRGFDEPLELEGDVAPVERLGFWVHFFVFIIRTARRSSVQERGRQAEIEARVGDGVAALVDVRGARLVRVQPQRRERGALLGGVGVEVGPVAREKLVDETPVVAELVVELRRRLGARELGVEPPRRRRAVVLIVVGVGEEASRLQNRSVRACDFLEVARATALVGMRPSRGGSVRRLDARQRGVGCDAEHRLGRGLLFGTPVEQRLERPRRRRL
mmetsp:Transcript_22150/g.87877  ORF Transcript_22150/g.87877 Transcript_22150/m.87877 type:complete len:280 (-) Transcript_22150:209-1048(-)